MYCYRKLQFQVTKRSIYQNSSTIRLQSDLLQKTIDRHLKKAVSLITFVCVFKAINNRNYIDLIVCSSK